MEKGLFEIINSLKEELDDFVLTQDSLNKVSKLMELFREKTTRKSSLNNSSSEELIAKLDRSTQLEDLYQQFFFFLEENTSLEMGLFYQHIGNSSEIFRPLLCAISGHSTLSIEPDSIYDKQNLKKCYTNNSFVKAKNIPADFFLLTNINSEMGDLVYFPISNETNTYGVIQLLFREKFTQKDQDQLTNYTKIFTKYFLALFLSNKVSSLQIKISDQVNSLTVQQKVLDKSTIVAETDLSGRIIFANKNFLNTTKYSLEEVLGKRHNILSSGFHSNNYYRKMWKHLQSGKVWKGEFKNIDAEGNEFWLESNITPIKNSLGETTKYMAVSIDITKLKQFNQKISKVLKSKQRFFNNVYHEIKTPLNAIVGLTQIMKKDNLGTKLEKDCEQIAISSNELLTIFNDMALISKIDENEVQVNKLNFSLSSLINSIEDFYKNKSVNISFRIKKPHDLAEMINCDEEKLRIIIHHLLDNAFKFTHQGEIVLSIDIVSDFLKISVRDTGIGIKNLDKERIFSGFAQLDDSKTRSFGGIGRGLNLCYKLIDLCAGNIEIVSSVGNGTKVEFSLPCGIVAEELPKKSLNPNMNILIVEDNKINQKVLSSILKKINITNINFAFNGEESLEILKVLTPDLIFMDVQMPVMDGLEATKQIKSKYKNLKAPIVGLSANSFSEDIKEALDAGMDDYLTKPVNIEELTKVLKKFS